MKWLFGVVFSFILCLGSACSAQETGGPPLLPADMVPPLVCGKIHNYSSGFILVWKSEPNIPNSPGVYRMLNPHFSTPSYEDWDYGSNLNDTNVDGTLKWFKCDPLTRSLDMYFGPCTAQVNYPPYFWFGNEFYHWETWFEAGILTSRQATVPQSLPPSWTPEKVYGNLPSGWTLPVEGSYWNGSGGGPTPPGP